MSTIIVTWPRSAGNGGDIEAVGRSWKQPALLLAVLAAALCGCKPGGSTEKMKACTAPCCQSRASTSEQTTGPEANPIHAFDELTRHALRGEREYVRQRLGPAFLAAAKAAEPNATDDHIAEEWTNQLAFCHALAFEGHRDNDAVVMTVASINPTLFSGAVGQFRIQLAYDKKTGWQLASLPYDKGPLTVPAAAQGGTP